MKIATDADKKASAALLQDSERKNELRGPNQERHELKHRLTDVNSVSEALLIRSKAIWAKRAGKTKAVRAFFTQWVSVFGGFGNRFVGDLINLFCVRLKMVYYDNWVSWPVVHTHICSAGATSPSWWLESWGWRWRWSICLEKVVLVARFSFWWWWEPLASPLVRSVQKLVFFGFSARFRNITTTSLLGWFLCYGSVIRYNVIYFWGLGCHMILHVPVFLW